MDPLEQNSVQFDNNTQVFFWRNVFENASCEMVAFLFMSRCVTEQNNWAYWQIVPSYFMAAKHEHVP